MSSKYVLRSFEVLQNHDLNLYIVGFLWDGEKISFILSCRGIKDIICPKNKKETLKIISHKGYFCSSPTLMQWAMDMKMPLTKNVVEHVCKVGNIEILELICINCDKLSLFDIMGSVTLCKSAASQGNISVLKWLRLRSPPCPWNSDVIEVAAHNGHIDCLQHIRLHTSPVEWTSDICNAAAQNNQLEVLKWLRSLDPPCPWDVTTCATAALMGNLDILQWLREQNPPCPWDEDACSAASATASLNILQWLRSQDPPCPWTSEAARFAAQQGHINVLTWIHAQDASLIDHSVYKHALIGKVPEIIKWLHDINASKSI